LKHLTERDLLRIRPTSHIWSRISTTLCRKSFVRLRHLWYRHENALEFFTIFRDVSSVHWSSYCFDEFHSKESDQVEELKQKFLTVFGKLILQANVVNEADCDKVLAVLKMTPNLSKLIIQGPDLSPWFNPITGFAQVGCEDKVLLPNLKILNYINELEQGKSTSIL